MQNLSFSPLFQYIINQKKLARCLGGKQADRQLGTKDYDETSIESPKKPATEAAAKKYILKGVDEIRKIPLCARQYIVKLTQLDNFSLCSFQEIQK